MRRAGRPAYRRRKFIVNPPFQYRFVGAMLGFVFVLMLAILAGIYFALWGTLYTFELLHDPVTVSLFTMAGLAVALELLLLAPFVIWIGILMTHKVAGPLVRIYGALSQMAEGDFDVHLTLRKGDALIELADGINRLAAALRRKSPA